MSSPASLTHICPSASWNQRSVASILSRIWRDSFANCKRELAEQIATMQWVQEHTSIPVPKILAYELDRSHPLGAHIFLEKARFHFSGLPFVFV